MATSEVVAPAWLHRFIIGKKGASIRKITEEFPKVMILSRAKMKLGNFIQCVCVGR